MSTNYATGRHEWARVHCELEAILTTLRDTELDVAVAHTRFVRTNR